METKQRCYELRIGPRAHLPSPTETTGLFKTAAQAIPERGHKMAVAESKEAATETVTIVTTNEGCY